ncbi:MAG: hypothetical protein LBB34_02750, partial [Holosporales bacterium]|nr:hypothetical protein [Holosporales bacterium]
MLFEGAVRLGVSAPTSLQNIMGINENGILYRRVESSGPTGGTIEEIVALLDSGSEEMQFGEDRRVVLKDGIDAMTSEIINYGRIVLSSPNVTTLRCWRTLISSIKMENSSVEPIPHVQVYGHIYSGTVDEPLYGYRMKGGNFYIPGKLLWSTSPNLSLLRDAADTDTIVYSKENGELIHVQLVETSSNWRDEFYGTLVEPLGKNMPSSVVILSSIRVSETLSDAEVVVDDAVQEQLILTSEHTIPKENCRRIGFATSLNIDDDIMRALPDIRRGDKTLEGILNTEYTDTQVAG